MSEPLKEYIPLGKKKCSNCHREFDWDSDHNCIPQVEGQIKTIPYFTGQMLVRNTNMVQGTAKPVRKVLKE